MATYAQFKHVELFKIGHGKNRVPNAPKSCIAEIFSGDQVDSSPVKNGNLRPRVVRDTPTRPRDTHSRLFGQGRVSKSSLTPLVTDNTRSNIQFSEANGTSPTHSTHALGKPNGMNGLANGSAVSTPSSRGETEVGEHSYSSFSAPPKRNPVTGDGVALPVPRRPHPAASLRGATPRSTPPHEPQPTHRYITSTWPPRPAHYYVESTTKPVLAIDQTPYSLIGLQDLSSRSSPKIDPNSLSPQPILDRRWPPFPAQHYLETNESYVPHRPLPPHAFVGMTSALGDRPSPDYKHNPVPSLGGPIDPYLVANTNPPPSLFKYERDGPIPDVSLLQTAVAPGPHTLTGFPPIFHKHVPGYLFKRDRFVDDTEPKTYFVDHIRQREEGNPITGNGYKSMNGQINLVTSITGNSSILHHRVPPGGYSSGLW